MKIFILFSLVTLTILSCKESPIDYAQKWSTEIKTKILEDVAIPTDSISVDTPRKTFKEVTFYSKAVRTKRYGIRISNGDTLLCILYSKDQNFEIVRELCPGIERSFEGIRYKGEHLGLAEFRFCNGKLMEQGYRFKGDVGVWREWDENGNVISEKDKGQTEKLEGLRAIKYYR